MSGPMSGIILKTPEQVEAMAEAGRLLGIVVHDHVIIGRHGHVSLRAKGLI